MEHPRGKTFEQQRIIVGDRQVMQRALCVAKREREGAHGRTRLAVLLRERQRGIAIPCDAGGEREPRGRARRVPDPLPQAEDRIEHDAGRARQRTSVERHGIPGIPSAPQKARPIGLPLDGALRATLQAQHMHRPQRLLRRRPQPPMAQQRRAVGDVLGFKEELAKRRMGCVGRRGGQRDFHVAGDIDLARARPLIGHGQASYLDVILGGDGNVELAGERPITATDRHTLGPKRHQIVVRLHRRRLVLGGPRVAAPDVAQIHVRATRIERGVTTRTSHRNPLPQDAATSGVGHDGDEPSVRQELGVREDRVRRAKPPDM